jgi:hypothetical protein
MRLLQAWTPAFAGVTELFNENSSLARFQSGRRK